MYTFETFCWATYFNELGLSIGINRGCCKRAFLITRYSTDLNKSKTVFSG